MPRLLFLIRTACCIGSPATAAFGSLLRDTLGDVTNTVIDDLSWSLALLPVRWGGLGVQVISTLSHSAVLVSLNSSDRLIHSLLPLSYGPHVTTFGETALASWSASCARIPLSGSAAGSQQSWDDPVCSHLFNSLLAAGGPTDKARLLAGCAWSSGSWLHAIFSAHLGLHLGDEEVRIAVGLRLGSYLVVPHSCPCGVKVASDGLHGLSCHRSAGRLSRHAAVNDVFARAFRGVNDRRHWSPQASSGGMENALMA